MDSKRLQFYGLYLTRFAEGFGFITLITLLPEYIDLLDPQNFALPLVGITLSAGFIIGMYTTGFTLAQTFAVVPLAWAGDRYDKRLVLLGSLSVGIVAYALFPLLDTDASGASLLFILARALQGVAVTGASLMSLSLVGELASGGTRAREPHR